MTVSGNVAPPHIISRAIEQHPTTTPSPSIARESTKKRKRDAVDTTDTANACESFTIRPHPPSVYDKPLTFMPVTQLARAYLPLSFLDPSGPPISSSRLFGASRPLINGLKDVEEKNVGPEVLVARHEPSGGLFALEKVQDTVYALCKLGKWLTAKDVQQLDGRAGDRPTPRKCTTVKSANNAGSWWESAAIEVLPQGKKPRTDGSAPRIAMMHPPTSIAHSARPEQQGTTPAQPLDPAGVPSAPINQELAAFDQPPTAEQALENFVIQYLDAIYLSRTPLAFFAKGPISRVRALFTSGEDESMQACHLVVFLRSMLLNMSSMDKKYKMKLPEILKDAHLESMSEDEGNTNLIPKLMRRAKSKKQLKLNREGMYQKEDQVVKRWWKFGDEDVPHSSPDETLDAAIRRRIAEVRFRETLAQVILILEILALESSSGYQPPTESQAQAIAVETQAETQLETQVESNLMTSKAKKKPKKPQDLKLLVELLLDKLTIWQSIEQEDTAFKPASLSDANNSKISNTDKLKNFCVEVIVPFYMSKVPEMAASINRKLGGPKAISPPKKPVAKTFKKPGQPEARQGPQKNPRRSLGRVTSDTVKQTIKRPPSLARSATDGMTPIPGLKRERSETPLSAIPFQRGESVSSRASMSHYQRFASREVDLTAMSAVTAAKRKRKEAIEQELKQAITTLKKPNRSQAVKEFADSADLRNQPWSKKPGNPIARTFQSVQVNATPKHSRVTKPLVRSSLDANTSAIEEDQGSSATKIPSSILRPPPSSFVPGTVTTNRHVDTSQAKLAGVQETPSRGPAKSFDVFGTTPAHLDAAETPMRAPVTPSHRASQLKNREKQSRPSIARSLFPAGRPKAAQRLEAHKAAPASLDSSTAFATPQKPAPSLVSSETVSDTPIAKDTARPATTAVAAGFATPQKLVAVPEQRGIATVVAHATTPMKPVASQESLGVENIYDALGWNDDDVDELAY